MHFVDKKSDTDYKNVVSILAEYSKTEMPKWVKFKNDERTEPKGFWTEPEIREPLSELFLNCCGYCGQKLEKNKEKKEYEGEVEHFIPKSKKYAIENDLIYNWNNYIWSCHSCNRKKSAYFDLGLMLFNPSNKKDCSYIFFNPDKGNYQLRKKITDEKIKERYEITFNDKLVWINRRMRNRKTTYDTIIPILNSIKNNRNLEKILKKEKFKKKAEKESKKLKIYKEQASYKLLIRETISKFNNKNNTHI